MRYSSGGRAVRRRWLATRYMQPAPDDKGPSSAMPYSAEEHCHHQVDVAPRLTPPIAAERDVEIVPQELGQGHVPAGPEFHDPGCLVWRGEVEREPHAE